MRLPKRKPGKYAMDKADLHFTQEKLDTLKAELESLKKAQPFAASEVSRLAQLGDLSENAAYQIAKGKLRGINHRIIILGNKINGAIMIEKTEESGTVQLGSLVTVKMEDKEMTYQILGSAETDPLRGIISHNSPIGSALMGHRVGETAVCKIKDKEVECKIIRIK